MKWAHRVEGLRATFSARQARLKRARDRTASCAIVPAVVEHARLLTVVFEPTIRQLTIRPVAGAGKAPAETLGRDLPTLAPPSPATPTATVIPRATDAGVPSEVLSDGVGSDSD